MGHSIIAMIKYSLAKGRRSQTSKHSAQVQLQVLVEPSISVARSLGLRKHARNL
jgi:hypothetical protein